MKNEEYVGVVGIVFGSILFIIGTVVFSAIYHGFIVMKLWNWLLVPIFPEILPQLNVVYAIGFAYVVGFLTKATVPSSKSDGDTWDIVANYINLVFITPTIVLLIGWVISMFY